MLPSLPRPNIPTDTPAMEKLLANAPADVQSIVVGDQQGLCLHGEWQ